MEKFIFKCPECDKVIFICHKWEIRKPKGIEKFTMAYLRHCERYHPDLAKAARPWSKMSYFPFFQGGRACGK